MPTSADILWFKTEFQSQIEPALSSTPLTVDFITAIACQETGELWPVLRRKSLTTAQILALCVGDTLDADKGRSAFPTTKADLLSQARGDEMFAIAHEALVNMAAHIPAYSRIAARPDKFCHGFGLFQLDLQFFREDPAYFLQKNYERFDRTLAKCVIELKRALKKLGYDKRASLSDLELAAVGIAYNTGRFNPQKGLKQGHFNGTRYYGEAIFDFIQLAHTVALPGSVAPLNPPETGQAIVPAPSEVIATGDFFRVDTREGTLRLRSEPKVSSPPQANVIGNLPDGHVVRAVTGKSSNAFIEVETSLAGALLRGFASTKFLVPAPEATQIPVVEPAPAPPSSGIVAVLMPRKPKTFTKRTNVATAHSLNETGQPESARRDAGRIARRAGRHRRLAGGGSHHSQALSAARGRDVLQCLQPRLLPSGRRLPATRVVDCQSPAIAYCRHGSAAVDRRNDRRDAGQRSLQMAARLRSAVRLASNGNADQASDHGKPGRRGLDRGAPERRGALGAYRSRRA